MSLKSLKGNKKWIVVSLVLFLVVVFAIAWFATGKIRFTNKEMKNTTKQVELYRSGERDYFDFSFYDYVAEDPRVEKMVISLVAEMCDNGETEMLMEFIDRLVFTEFYSPAVLSTLEEKIIASDNIDFMLQMRDFASEGDFYFPVVPVLRDSGTVYNYIQEHGIKEITMTPGEGYYADMENTSSTEVIGLEDSPLYSSHSVGYFGDFARGSSDGVHLDFNYEEQEYGSTRYYFRDQTIPFDPFDQGEVVWSGDYLFDFHSNGYLNTYAKIKE